ncbi:thioredoxin family protein [Chryseobacterium sp. SC28]|uniref:thioredoxin family protein n=1 Tax=Chryseobacterium sp. SC28 TaxID=2268028 RepID=UPI000F64A7B9|nr:thioredoxin family protein [Chryseobacterium sp. SC28]RRQ47400.1 thioredoxin family protein [Chryseobacterium sp. SC28]
MSNTPSNMLALGTKAPDFSLPNPAKNNEIQSLDSLKGKKGTLIVFMCNHCPFVLHIIDKLEELYEDYRSQGIEFIGINANDADQYPADSPEKMVEFVQEKNINFPYLFDESQDVAKAYDAACTPDFYFFDDDLKLIYRGQMDDSRPGNQKEITGEDLIIAFENHLAGQAQEDLQRPSLGCNIKWKKKEARN